MFLDDPAGRRTKGAQAPPALSLDASATFPYSNAMPMTPQEEREFLTLLFIKDHTMSKELDAGGFINVYRVHGRDKNKRRIKEKIASWLADESPPVDLLREWYADELEKAWGNLL